MKKNGKCYLKKVDGTVYKGYFRDDKFEGFGELTIPEKINYRGDFKDGQYHGKGKLTSYKNGIKIMQYDG